MGVKRDKTPNLKRRILFEIICCVCRVLFAVTFIVSGLAKATDPWSLILPLKSYFVEYGITAPEWLVTALSIGWCAAELSLGVMLLFKLFIRITSLISVVLMVFFTVLTLLNATIFTIEDCGCFGELIKFTPWESFAKNLVLLPLAICFWSYYRREQIFEYWKRDLLCTLAIVVASAGLTLYSYRHLPIPIFDNSPYKEGTDIKAEMEKSRDGETTEKVVLLYRNLQTNEIHEFSVDDTTWHDTSLWEWVETRVESNEDVESTLLEFYISDSEGDKTAELLAMPKLYMLFVADEEYGEDVVESFNTVEKYAQDKGGKVVYITPNDLSAFHDSAVPYYNMDAKTMKTILRADYGLVVLEKGVVTEKYNYRDIPF